GARQSGSGDRDRSSMMLRAMRGLRRFTLLVSLGLLSGCSRAEPEAAPAAGEAEALPGALEDEGAVFEAPRPSSLASDVAGMDFKTAQGSLQRAEAELGETLSLAAPNCELAAVLAQRICALAERICALSRGKPNPGADPELCPDSTARCQAARRRVAQRCE